MKVTQSANTQELCLVNTQRVSARNTISKSSVSTPQQELQKCRETIAALEAECETLRQSEHRFRILSETAPVGIFQTDAIGRCLYANPTYLALTGLTLEQVLKGRGREIIHPEDRKSAIGSWKSFLKTGGNYEREFRLLLPGGILKHVSVQAAPLKDETDRTIGFVGAAEDITARRTSEAQQKRLAAILETTTDYIATSDLEGRVLYQNSALRNLLGSEESSDRTLQGERRIKETFPGWAMERFLNEALPAAVQDGIWSGETAFINQENREVPVSQVLLAHRDSSGQVEYLSTVARNISAHKEMETEIEASKRLLQKIADTAPVLLFLHDLHKQSYLYCNSEFEVALGYTPEQIQAMGWHLIPTLMHPEDLERYPEHVGWLTSSQDGEIVEFEYRMKHADGSYVWLYSRETVFSRSANGLPREVLGVAQDITERKRIEERIARQNDELRRSNAELEQFAYVVSHDLQEPLRMIGGFTKRLGSRYMGQLDADADDYIRFTLDGVDRMQNLIVDLLAYSRIGVRRATTVRLDSKKALTLALANLAAVIGETGAVINFDDLPEVRADVSQIIQLFQNLIGNAIKFRSELTPSIHIRAERQGKMWRFCISDNGIGIDAKQSERVFAVFQRLHPQGKYSGTGIGLAICKKIVENLGGRIWFESRKHSEQKGTEFYFTLPEAAGSPS